jgi:phage replication-related protein YjqB (UPF0714/DUF867 family)
MPRKYEYQSMKALLAKESQENYNFDIITDGRSQRCAILAPHGGEIEWGTNQIAKAIAELGQYRFFAFNGHRKGGENRHYLHVYSHEYENDKTRLEKKVSCREVTEPCDFVLAIHGAQNAPDNSRKVYIGGRDETLKIRIFNDLEAIHTALSFKIVYLTDGTSLPQVQTKIGSKLNVDVTLSDSQYREYAGLHKDNICNKGRSGRGAQLEISKKFRDDMVPAGGEQKSSDFQTFVSAVEKAMRTMAGDGSRG